jgi:hypothetical protein
MTRVTPALRDAVFARDGRCVLFNLDPDHVCRDKWGQPHIASRTDLLTIEHVKRELRMGVRAPSDLRHCVSMCWAGNLGPPTKDQRQAIRAYLEEVNATEVTR